MDSKFIPFLKLAPFAHEMVFKNMTVDEIIHVSALSARARNAINNARIVPIFVSINRERQCGLLEIQLRTGPKLCWNFLELEEGMGSDANFRELTNQIPSAGLSDKIICRTVCTDFRSTTAMVFEEMNHLFQIILINSCSLAITGNANELRLDRLIQPIERCKNLNLSVHGSGRKALPLTWLLQKIHVEEQLRVLNNRSATVTYDTHLPGEKLVFSGKQNYQSISLQHLTNITRIHVLSNSSVPVEKMNSILRAWKQGSLPNLELIEHRGNKNTGNTYMPALLQGLDDRDWDQGRDEFNMVLLFMTDALYGTFKSLKFRQGRDIKRHDGMMGTVIPFRSNRYDNKFVFAVWSKWINNYLRGLG